MPDENAARLATGTLIYNSEYNCLELDGYELQSGENIEIRVFGSWVPGQVSVDSGGWYLFTLDHVGIRLHTGLPARFANAGVVSASILQPSLTPPPHILIVDDDPGLLSALPRALTLRMPGIRVDVSESPFEALKMIHRQRYDAIVSDIKMPGMDGLVLLSRIREVQPDTPTLLITGHGEHDLAIQALRGGAYDYIQKPIDRDSFVAALLRAIQTCQLRRRVEEQQAALELHARSLERMVIQRTNELIEANTTKDKVISLVTHEMKTPIDRLKNITTLLRQKLEGTEVDAIVSQGFLEIEQSVARTEGLVQDLLNTSRLETGMFILHRERRDLVELCQMLLDEHAKRYGQRLVCDFVHAPVEAEVDAEQVRQVFDTLLSRTPEQQEVSEVITVTLQQAKHEAIITVRDLNAHIGLGLGLYVSRKIMERHGGHLEVQRFPENRSTFFLMLPLLPESMIEEEDMESTSQQFPSTHAVWTITDRKDDHLRPDSE
jgi:FixJ family two-component response regulator